MAMEEEKLQILKYYTMAYRDRLMAGTSGNASCYDPETGLMAITPSGVDYRALTPDSLAVMRTDGSVVEGRLPPSSEWRLHAEVYKTVPEARALLHTHSRSATAFAVCRRPIPPTLIECGLFLGGEVPVAPYAPNGTQEVAELTAETLRGHVCCLMANHGVAARGRTMEEAYLRACYAEDAADIYLRARLIGEPVVLG